MTPRQIEDELIGYWWNLESCEEAIEMFDDFHQCPVCGAFADSTGLMVHSEFLIN